MHRGLPVYDDDPFVVVSLFHIEVEKHTLNLDIVMQQFVGGDVSTSVWGPIAWRILHRIHRDKIEPLIRCWEHVLPCQACRSHLSEHIRHTQFDFASQQAAHRYTVALHNAVNLQLGKKLFIL